MNRLKIKIHRVIELLPDKPQLLVKRLYTQQITGGQAANLKICSFDGPPGYFDGTYEKGIQDSIARRLKPGDVFYDIGANYGFFSIIGAKRVGKTGQVYAFEPVPKNASMIRLNANLNRFHQIKVIDKAVSDKEEKQEIWLTQNPGGATLTSTGIIPPDMISKLKVGTVVIDSLVDRGKIRPPSLIKIDVEGAELHVFRGMSGTLKKYLPFVFFEIDDLNLDLLNKKVDQSKHLLTELGYTITRLENAYPKGKSYVAHFLAEPCRR
jgi:FkbM family methyltransferase